MCSVFTYIYMLHIYETNIEENIKYQKIIYFHDSKQQYLWVEITVTSVTSVTSGQSYI